MSSGDLLHNNVHVVDNIVLYTGNCWKGGLCYVLFVAKTGIHNRNILPIHKVLFNDLIF